MRDLEIGGVVADKQPHLAVTIFHLEEGAGIALEFQLATLFVVDVFGFHLQNSIRLVVVVGLLVHVDVHEAWHFLK